MSIHKAALYAGLASAVAVAGLTWASSVVVLHPATINGSVSFDAEAVTRVSLHAYSSDGGSGTSLQFSVPGPGPRPYSLTVEGGDPQDPSQNGKDYQVSATGFFSGGNGTSYLTVTRTAATHVTYPGGDATGVDFNYPDTTRANASLNVIGGMLYAGDLFAGCDTASEEYSSYSRVYPDVQGASAGSAFIPMARCSAVTVAPVVYVMSASGSITIYMPPAQTVDLSQGPGELSWTVDVRDHGQLAGNIAIANAPFPLARVTYSGVTGSPNQVITGDAMVTTTSTTGGTYTGTYSVDLPPGDYDVGVSLQSLDFRQYTSLRHVQVSVATGATTSHDFIETLASAHAPIAVTGFYTNHDLSSLQMSIASQVSETTAAAFVTIAPPSDGQFDFKVADGTWSLDSISLVVQNTTNPDQPISSRISKSYVADADHPAVTIAPGGDATLAATQITLVSSDVYFQVAQPDGAPPVNVSSPSINAYKSDYNPDTSLRSTSQINASGAAAGKPLSKVTVVAEPGTYTLDARATVNGTSTSFGGTTITFGAPAPTTTAGSPVVLMSEQDSGLQLDLTFASITQPGVSTMVESLLGPAPPAGIKAACDPNDAGEGLGLPCAPIYYDLRTTAQWGGLTKVCVRRRFSDDYFNAVTDFLQLWHFNEARPAGAQWEQLPPPPPPAGIDCAAEPDNAACRAGFDCTADPSQCDNCPGEVSCEHVFRICGMTSSFSPVTVGLGTIELSNTVGGHAYTGAGGPPALQRWTVPGDGVYRITATGATGGRPTTSTTLLGGCGAEITGDLALQRGDVLQILVGQQGTSTAQSGGGGGGTFVTRNGSPLIVAGGGGGLRSGATVNGLDASLTPDGATGSTSANHAPPYIAGGSGGAGGAHTASYGAGGGGWSGNGEADGTLGDGGFAFTAAGANQGKGGAGKSCGALAHGGYGGGGAGNGCFGGGGGGGYSGGGAGRVAGGGGSWNTGANPVAGVRCTTSGHGHVTIKLISD